MGKQQPKPIERRCNRCNALKTDNSACKHCGCPEYRIVSAGKESA